MSDRSKHPTMKTTPEVPAAKKMIGSPTVPEVRDSMEDMATHIFDSGKFPRKRAGEPDTVVDPHQKTLQGHESPLIGVGPQPPPVTPPQAKIQAKSMKDQSMPIQVRSMKTLGQTDRPDTPARAVPQVKLRAMSEVASGKVAQPENLGYLAPPRDAREVRARRTTDLVIWACVCVMIACGIALGIWFLAK